MFSPSTFGHKGQVFDGWETRRRRGEVAAAAADEHDWVIVRLGAPGVVHAVVVDTAYFTGNFPQSCSLEACDVPGYPGPAALAAARWLPVVPRSPLKGDTAHVFEVPPRGRFSHVRLNVYPDGGVARLRVHGQVVPDPALLEGLTFDLAALENGGDVRACSDRFYSSPRNAISPGLSRVMGEGWETRRRRVRGTSGWSWGSRRPRWCRSPRSTRPGTSGTPPPWPRCAGTRRSLGGGLLVGAAAKDTPAAGHAAPVPVGLVVRLRRRAAQEMLP